MVKSTRRHRQRGAGLSDVLPVTTWGQWAQYPGALAWSANTQAPPPLANGGLYTAQQSTGAWASSPFPATQYAQAVEAARVSGNPDVFYHQRPADNSGASFSPYVSQPLSNQHYSAQARVGGAHRRRRNMTRRRRNMTRRRR
jgi:hypothetical protein